MASFYDPAGTKAVWARYLRSWADAIDDGSLEVERGTMDRKTAEYLDAQEAEGVVCRTPTGIMTFDATAALSSASGLAERLGVAAARKEGAYDACRATRVSGDGHIAAIFAYDAACDEYDAALAAYQEGAK